MRNKLFKPIDNSALIVFRIFFGLVFIAESYGAIITGWTRKNTIDPVVNFTFIGFEWLHYLMSDYMYFHFALMGLVSIGVALGYKYRFSIIALTILWGCVYFMQKTSYNNHYYLMWLIALMMCFLPANASASIDAKLNPKIRTSLMPQWCSWIFIFQIACVYIFATVAKFYPDWLNGTFTHNLFSNMKVHESLKPIFQNHKFHMFMAYAGIAFDGLIIPALLWKRTRILAIIASLFFHIFNSVTLHIGVFPYFALCFSVFFFPPEQVGKYLLRRKYISDIDPTITKTPPYKSVFYCFFVPYMILQTALPLRHHFFKGDVLWNEEGHRLSWRMMLRSRSGEARFKVIDKKNGDSHIFDNSLLLKPKQKKRLNTPDMIWQMAQFIKEYYAEKGKDVAVYAINSNVSINRKPSKRLINPEVDLASEKWQHFRHHDWILDENDPKYHVLYKNEGLKLHHLKQRR